MSKLKSLYTFHPVVILLCGLVIAQIIGTTQVYLSNLQLYNTLSRINSAGYLAIPNKLVMGALRALAPAFWGGFFLVYNRGRSFACRNGSILAMGSHFLAQQTGIHRFSTYVGGFSGVAESPRVLPDALLVFSVDLAHGFCIDGEARNCGPAI